MNTYLDDARSMLHEVYKSEVSYTSYIVNKYKAYKYICIFGAGNIGRPTAIEMKLHGIKVDYFCDNDLKKVGKIIDGILCISIGELCKIKNETVVIICGRAFKDICNQLYGLGFEHVDRLHVNKFRIRDCMCKVSEEVLLDKWAWLFGICEDEISKKICLRILHEWCANESGNLNDICSDDQYFCRDIVRLSNHEVVVDGGAYNGDTLKQFLQLYEDFDKYYMFELSKINYDEMKSNISLLDAKYKAKIECINSGLSDRTGAVRYSEDDEGASLENEELGNKEGYVTTIDEICKESNVSFIKMDIEGSELSALKGAEQCIRNRHPKLAICLYHKPEDMWRIPMYIKNINRDYKLYIRHHTDLMNETVCYAI